MENPNRSVGILAMTVTAFLWSIGGLFIKIIDWNPIAITCVRSFIASIVIVIYLKRFKIHFSLPQIAASIAGAATMILFVSANKFTTAANAILLQHCALLLTVFMGAILLKERTCKEHFVALSLVLPGMVLMVSDGLCSGRLLGNILGGISAITFSFYFIFLRMQKDGSPLESILLSHWLTAGICLAISLFLPLPHITLKSLAAIAALGIFQVGFAGILLCFAIRRLSAVQLNLIAVIEPVFNPVWVFFAIGETPGIRTLVGGGIVILAVAMASVISARRKEYVVREPHSTILRPIR